MEALSRVTRIQSHNRKWDSGSPALPSCTKQRDAKPASFHESPEGPRKKTEVSSGTSLLLWRNGPGPSLGPRAI